MTNLRFVLAALASWLIVVAVGCGEAEKPATNSQPAGVQKAGKDGRRTMPAPPPIEKVK